MNTAVFFPRLSEWMICLKNEIILPEAVVFDDSGKINQQTSGEGGRSLISGCFSGPGCFVACGHTADAVNSEIDRLAH